MNLNKRVYDDISFEQNDSKKIKLNQNDTDEIQQEIIFLIKNENNTNTMFGGIKSFSIEQYSDLIYYQTLKSSMRFIQKKYVIAYKYANSESWIYLP